MLASGASDDVLVRAAAANQTAWMARTAEAAGGVVHRERGATWMASPAGTVLAFPRLSRERLDALLPRLLDAATSTPEASCWSRLPTSPPDLGAALLAAGFRCGWQAHWMAAEIGATPAVHAPAGVRVDVVEKWEPTGLPWDGEGVAPVRELLASERPRRVWHVPPGAATSPWGT